MDAKMVEDERRRERRIQVTTGTLVFNQMIFGELIDISRGGLSFSYRGDKSKTLGEQLELDILCGADAFFLSKIPCRTVSDVELTRGQSIVFSKRRRSVAFNELSPEQSVLLEHFYSSHSYHARARRLKEDQQSPHPSDAG